ncbi:MAG: hypothetical protein OXE48_08080 [Gammaproteobacteria bacterium]|nr:hypothetical protein [Gammaproteobacteria bacterium]
MTPYVVDTNVVIVANGGETTHADLACQLSCIEKLESVVEENTIAIDSEHLLLDEYQRNLSASGQPGAGDKFFKHVLNFQYRDANVVTVPVTRSNDERRGFAELPRNTLDPSDRKFLAVAVVAKAIVLNATDSDWDEQKPLMDTLGVKVEQLCPPYARKPS